MPEPNLCSMTGYGRATLEFEMGRFEVELKSVNGRYQEIRVHLAPSLSALEAPVRDLLKAGIKRGKTDCRVQYTPTAGRVVGASFNEDLLMQYAERLRSICSHGGIKTEVTLDHLLRLPGVIEPPANDSDTTELIEPLSQCVRQALEAFQAERAREGAVLAAQLSDELAVLRDRQTSIESVREQVIQKYRDRLAARIEELQEKIQAQFDSGRLELEVALYADRCDVSEELVRLGGHLERFEHLIANPKGESVGKAFDFLVQEILREVNTLASKLRDLDVVASALDMKAAVERIREQIQNIE